jgi:hypothetical protein
MVGTRDPGLGTRDKSRRYLAVVGADLIVTGSLAASDASDKERSERAHRESRCALSAKPLSYPIVRPGSRPPAALTGSRVPRPGSRTEGPGEART